MAIKVTGIRELQNHLSDLQQKVERLAGTKQVSLPNLLTPGFLSQCSRFNTADEMFKASGFKVESLEDFKAIPDAEWDEFVRANTSYISWHVMLGEASKAWALNQLE